MTLTIVQMRLCNVVSFHLRRLAMFALFCNENVKVVKSFKEIKGSLN